MSEPTTKHSPVTVTKSERLLSWILAGFVLLALSWGYVNIDDKVSESRAAGHAELMRAINANYERMGEYQRSIGLNDEYTTATPYGVEEQIGNAEYKRDSARERYRTTVDEGAPNAALKRKYLAAEATLKRLEAQQKLLAARRSAAEQKLRSYEREHAAETRRTEQKLQSYEATTDRIVFILRLLMTLFTLGLSVWLLRWVTERSPRAQPLAQAGVIAGSLMLLTLIIDYSEISFDFATVGPLGMAFLGALLTIGGFFGLQRYLRKRRPNRRLRGGECPACGYPGGTDFCENCGEQLRTTCSSCGQARRLGVAHCRTCGAT